MPSAQSAVGAIVVATAYGLACTSFSNSPVVGAPDTSSDAAAEDAAALVDTGAASADADAASRELIYAESFESTSNCGALDARGTGITLTRDTSTNQSGKASCKLCFGLSGQRAATIRVPTTATGVAYRAEAHVRNADGSQIRWMATLAFEDDAGPRALDSNMGATTADWTLAQVIVHCMWVDDIAVYVDD